MARMAAILMAGYRVGTQYCCENPADRGDSRHPRRYLDADHGPLWLMPEIRTLGSEYGGSLVTFPMCAFSAPWQKYTTLLYSPGLEEWFGRLGRLSCNHPSRAAGGTVGEEGTPSSETVAYPANFNHYVVLAFASLHRHGPAKARRTVTLSGERTKRTARSETRVRHQACASAAHPRPLTHPTQPIRNFPLHKRLAYHFSSRPLTYFTPTQENTATTCACFS